MGGSLLAALVGTVTCSVTIRDRGMRTSSSCASPWPVNNETWTWDGTTWTQQTPLTSPPARASAAMAYDTFTSTAILFSADIILTPTGYVYDADTWSWDGTTWTKQTPSTAPLGRWQAAATYDANTQTFFVFGGQPYSGPDFNDTCTYLKLGALNPVGIHRAS